jgi:hypothetical protein
MLTVALTALLAAGCGDGSATGDDPGTLGGESTASSAAAPDFSRSRASDRANNQEDPVKIQITIGDQRLEATLTDSATARDLVAQLPVTVDMIDHGGVEKTGPLPAPLSLKGQPEGADPDVGDLGYYAPGNDLVLYYGDQSYFPGIVILGRLDDDAAEQIAGMDGPVTATVEHGDRDEAAGLPRPREQRRADRRRLAAATVHA